MVYVFIYAVLKYWMVFVLMGYDYVESCTGQYNYSKLEGRLNTTEKRNADLWLSPRHSLSWIPGCATDATVIPQASNFLHLSCKTGKQYFSFSLPSLFCVLNLSEQEHSCHNGNNKATTEVCPKGDSWSDSYTHDIQGQSHCARWGCWMESPSGASLSLGQKESLWNGFTALC